MLHQGVVIRQRQQQRGLLQDHTGLRRGGAAEGRLARANSQHTHNPSSGALWTLMTMTMVQIITTPRLCRRQQASCRAARLRSVGHGCRWSD